MNKTVCIYILSYRVPKSIKAESLLNQAMDEWKKECFRYRLSQEMTTAVASSKRRRRRPRLWLALVYAFGPMQLPLYPW